MNTDSDEEPVIKHNVALCAHNSVSLETKQRRLNRDIPSEDENQLSLINRKKILYKAQQAMTMKSSREKRGPWGCQ